MRPVSLLAVLSLFVGCTGPDPVDAGGDASTVTCTSDDQCDDDLFCTGAERCLPSLAAADARGCVAESSPCLDGQSCLETTDRCETDCATTRDADGDGSLAAECGGDDCDDASPVRQPGALEVCDAFDVDEDCDPSTFGVRDLDADGYADGRCCNFDGAGMVCGPDCDDTSAAVSPIAVDTCDRAMRDEDCSGIPNDRVGGCACVDGDSRPCALPGACAAGTETCVDGAFASCSIGPVEEVCGGPDEDCDGAVDEGLTVTCWPDADGDDLAPAGSTPMEICPDPIRAAAPWLGCPANRVGTEPTTREATDCDDTSSTQRAAIRCFVDLDVDGVGGAAMYVCPMADGVMCPAGYYDTGGDCCDSDARAYPGATMFQSTGRTGCGGYDFDCDGAEQYDVPLNVSCGVFTVGEAACTSRNTMFMASPHFDNNAPPGCGNTGSYITGCAWNGTTCGNVTMSRLARCR